MWEKRGRFGKSVYDFLIELAQITTFKAQGHCFGSAQLVWRVTRKSIASSFCGIDCAQKPRSRCTVNVHNKWTGGGKEKRLSIKNRTNCTCSGYLVQCVLKKSVEYTEAFLSQRYTKNPTLKHLDYPWHDLTIKVALFPFWLSLKYYAEKIRSHFAHLKQKCPKMVANVIAARSFY